MNSAACTKQALASCVLLLIGNMTAANQGPYPAPLTTSGAEGPSK